MSIIPGANIPFFPGWDTLDAPLQQGPVGIELLCSLAEVSAVRRQSSFTHRDDGTSCRASEAGYESCSDAYERLPAGITGRYSF